MVSVEAHKIQAQRVIREVTPKVLIVSVKSPIEPPPEIGRISAKGTISVGIFKKLQAGAKTFESASMAPEARSMAAAESMAIRLGRMETTVRRPPSTPEIKVL